MCSFDGVRRAPAVGVGAFHLKWACPLDRPRETCGTCEDNSKCLEEAWGFFTKLMEAHKLDG